LIVFYPAGSAFGRLSILSNGKFHKAWLDRWIFSIKFGHKDLTPKNENMNKFDKAFQEIIAIEGGLVNDKKIVAVWQIWNFAKAFPKVDIRNLTIDGAKKIFRKRYWKIDLWISMTKKTRLNCLTSRSIWVLQHPQKHFKTLNLMNKNKVSRT
jgi:hypothetical protein